MKKFITMVIVLMFGIIPQAFAKGGGVGGCYHYYNHNAWFEVFLPTVIAIILVTLAFFVGGYCGKHLDK